MLADLLMIGCACPRIVNRGNYADKLSATMPAARVYGCLVAPPPASTTKRVHSISPPVRVPHVGNTTPRVKDLTDSTRCKQHSECTESWIRAWSDLDRTKTSKLARRVFELRSSKFTMSREEPELHLPEPLNAHSQ